MVQIDYQSIVDVVGQIMLISVPISMLFAVSGKLANALISMVTGERRVKL